MQVDSFTYLPRSFRAMYESPPRLPGEDAPIWAPMEVRLADATVALLTSAGLYVVGEQEPFDLDRERAEPDWGDPSWRPIPHDAPQGALGMAHLHVNPADTLADHDVSLPLRALGDLVERGVAGASAPTHYSVMGYQRAGLEGWLGGTVEEIVERLRDEQVDAICLAAS